MGDLPAEPAGVARETDHVTEHLAFVKRYARVV